MNTPEQHAPEGRVEPVVSSDAKRLLFLMRDTGIEGFVNVEKDRYELACEVACERTGDVGAEPTEADELEGFRRLLDAAMGPHDLTANA